MEKSTETSWSSAQHSKSFNLENFRIISFDVLRLNEVTKSHKNLW